MIARMLYVQYNNNYNALCPVCWSVKWCRHGTSLSRTSCQQLRLVARQPDASSMTALPTIYCYGPQSPTLAVQYCLVATCQENLALKMMLGLAAYASGNHSAIHSLVIYILPGSVSVCLYCCWQLIPISALFLTRLLPSHLDTKFRTCSATSGPWI